MPGGPVSRRSVTAGIAWSVPAIVVASAVPAYAVSRAPAVTGTLCWLGSWTDWFNENYRFTMTVVNYAVTPVTVTVTGVTTVLDNGTSVTFTSLTRTTAVTVAPGGTQVVTFEGQATSAAFHDHSLVTVNYAVAGGDAGSWSQAVPLNSC